ncbi:pulmonary surfactant-associated protein B [Bufo bufo]|uniref:pulmonary surfactant-associated protein B n=1 Tax=Bufo bufo TaxID=8384 RepID=UPI001ABEE4BF|nr:pulmonary surfactant-associated protein B [Bufo bufo]
MEGPHLSLACLLWVIAAVSGKVLVKEECAQGPDFWCQDLETAAHCGAVDHCKQNVWKENQDVLCSQCKQIVTILISMAKSSPIQSRIKNVLHQQCSRIPPFEMECIKMVDEYEEVLLSVLENRFNPTAVCTKLRICQSEETLHWDPELFTKPVLENILPLIQETMQTMHAKATQNVKEEWPIPMPLCWMCKSFVSKFEAAIPKAAIAKGASQLCHALSPKLSGVCQCLIEKYTIVVLDTILGMLGPKLLCGLLFMCVTDENCEPEVMPVLESDITCDTCMAITSIVKSTRGMNITQEEVSASLSKVCTSAKDWKECYAFIQDHQTELSDLLLKPWDHKITCQTLGVCPAPSKTVPENSACAAGPSYWCHSLDNARECKAIGHCLAHVWY